MSRESKPKFSRRRTWLLAVLVLCAGASMPGRTASSAVSPELQKAINEAIEKGAAWLRTQRSPDGSFDALFRGAAPPSYQMGLAGLCGLALLASGDSKTDPAMLKTLEYLKERDALEVRGGTRTTYGVGVLLMFITEMYRPAMQADKDGRYAKAKVKDPCSLPKDMQAWIQELASWLLDVQLEDGWWRYPHTPPADLSNTQYAMLGLRAARECGATVPLVKILKTLETTLDVQEKDGEKMKRIIKGTGKPGDHDYAVDGGDRARGWPYQRGSNVEGSMTTAGIAALAICRDMLLKPERFSAYTPEMDRNVGRSVQDGFAWLDKNFSVAHNPPKGASGWHYYYLYGLERACAFAGREAVGSHDWYAEGAALLVKQQKPDGRWATGTLGADYTPSDICDTAWALLFLKKASRPTAPIPAPVVTSNK